jgi:hypothetical protein
MNELQLRLWCLWMCDAYAGLPKWQGWAAAIQRADADTRRAMRALDQHSYRVVSQRAKWAEADASLMAWQLSERMP